MEIDSVTGTQAQGITNGPGLAQDFDTFLTLLTTQLQRQDPLDPMDSTEFTQQLVAFAGVEQQIRGNDKLDQLASLFSSNINTGAVNYLGKEAAVPGDTVNLDGQAGATWQYELDEAADNVTLQVRDDSGAVILETAGQTGHGRHTFEWDGLNKFGDLRDQGQFSLSVVAKDAEGKDIGSELFVQGIVDEVNTTGGDVKLTVRGNEVSLNDVQTIREPR